MKTLRNLISVSALGATAVAGAIVGSQLLGVADARVSSTDTNDATTTAAQTGEKSDATGAADAGARTDDRSTRATETALTGEQLTKATAAATAAQPGATVERAETDADGDAFEVHMTAADGSRITVKLDDLLHDRRMTLTDLADRIGITLANLSILKTGKARAIRFSTLEAICEALSCRGDESNADGADLSG
jgi:putative transcriptional regulator